MLEGNRFVIVIEMINGTIKYQSSISGTLKLKFYNHPYVKLS